MQNLSLSSQSPNVVIPIELVIIVEVLLQFPKSWLSNGLDKKKTKEMILIDQMHAAT